MTLFPFLRNAIWMMIMLYPPKKPDFIFPLDGPRLQLLQKAFKKLNVTLFFLGLCVSKTLICLSASTVIIISVFPLMFRLHVFEMFPQLSFASI